MLLQGLHWLLPYRDVCHYCSLRTIMFYDHAVGQHILAFYNKSELSSLCLSVLVDSVHLYAQQFPHNEGAISLYQSTGTFNACATEDQCHYERVK